MKVIAVLSEADAARATMLSTRRGWVVVACAFAVMFMTFGTAYSFSAFFASLQHAFAASRGDIALSFSIAVSLYYLVGAISGPLADRFGSRATCVLGMVIAGSGLMFAARANALWQIYVGFGLGLGLGIGSSYVPAIAAVQRWYVRRRGIASGIAVSGIGFGTLLMPPLAAVLIEWIGWRAAWAVISLSIVVIGGVVALFIDNSPSRYGALPDGGVSANSDLSRLEGLGLREAIASRPFILLYSSLITIWVGASIPFVHLVPYAEDMGLSHGSAVTIFGLVGIGSIAGRFLLGDAADRIGLRSRRVSMHRSPTIRITATLIAVVAGAILGGQIVGAQQKQPIKRTDLLKTHLSDVEGKEMQVWVADIPPGAATGLHFHPTPRFVYVIEGAVVLELDGKAPQTFTAGQAYVEMPGERHNFRNASTTEPAKALGFQYVGKDQPLQVNAP
jgi:MFS family permease